MKQPQIKIAALFIFIAITFEVLAIPATPFPVKITQPDGTQLSIRIHGDEYFNYNTTTDGYLLLSDETGVLNYAELKDGKISSLNVKASELNKRSQVEKNLIKTLIPNQDLTAYRNASKMLRTKKNISFSLPQKAYPLIGSPKSLVILVNFSDVKFSVPTPQTAFTNLLNQNAYSTNGGTGSAKDYFHDNSSGVFNPQFDVVGPVTLDNNMAYYGANDASGNDTNPQQMVIDACTKAAANGLDFSQYDTDKNGVVDNVFIYYAGYNEAEGGPKNSIWPHKWNLNDYSVKFNNVSIFHYACTSELRSNSGANMCGIGTFSHEFGHVLGLPDYYVTQNAPDHHTLSVWNIMDYGAYLNAGRTPPTYSAFDRFYLNWLIPTELKVSGEYSLAALASSNKAYLISQNGNHNLIGSNPSPVEFFTLENRQQSGWDAYLPGHGMLITHIYYNQSTWSSNTPNNDPNAMGVDIVEADGVAITETTSIDPTLAGDPFPGTSNVKSFNPVLRSGMNIKKPLLNIQETNGIIQFHFGTNITFIQSFQSFKTVQGTPSAIQTATISGSKLKGAINLSFKTGLQFEMKKDTDPSTSWSKNLTLTPVDSVVTSTNIQIRYNPTTPSYSDVHNDTFVASTSYGDYADAFLTGTSTRPVYVVPPVAKAATDTTYTSFVANWDKVFDATGYYATVYNINEGKSGITETFDRGIIAPNGWIITASTTSSSSIYSGGNPPSLQFQNTGEYVMTEKYLIPATTLSFYIRSMAAYGGGFTIQAQNAQNNWDKIDSIAVSATLYEKNKTYTFDESKGYNRFKFTYFKGTGVITFDDVTVGFSKYLNYLRHETWMTTTTDSLTNLIPGTEYFYKVRASDKSIHYENITDFSNTISVKTLGNVTTFGNKKNAQIIYITKNDGVIILKVSNSSDLVSVYNTLGQEVIPAFKPATDVVEIKNLAHHQFYFVKVGQNVVKVRL